MTNPLVTIYITSHNYEDYIADAIESVLSQTYPNIELIIFDDNSSDNSPSVIKEFKDNDNVNVILSNKKNGLRKASNECIKSANGEYVLRLDADDILNENCISNMIENIKRAPLKPKFVFSNYFYMDSASEVLGVELIHRSNGEYHAHSIPPHGACCLISKDVFETYGYYNETIKRQDGHELWIKILKNKLPFSHIEIPLWYYRKHGESLSSDNELLYKDRKILKQNLNKSKDFAIAFIPILESTFDVFNPIETGHLDRLVNEIRLSKKFKSIIISSDSKAVNDFCNNNNIQFHDRNDLIVAGKSDIFDSLKEIINSNIEFKDEIFCIVNLTSVNINKYHLQEIINTLQLYNSDSVISVYLENGIMYKMDKFGLSPINYDSQFKIRKDRDFVYIFNGALRALKGANIIKDKPFGQKIGHIEMSIRDSRLVKTKEQAARYIMNKNESD